MQTQIRVSMRLIQSSWEVKTNRHTLGKTGKQMIKKIILASMFFSSTALADYTAYWTGRSEQVKTVTYQIGRSCEYRIGTNVFWRAFIGNCPVSVQIR